MNQPTWRTGDEIAKALELLEPYLSIGAMEIIAEECEGRTSSPDPVYPLIAGIARTFIAERKRRYNIYLRNQSINHRE